MNCGEQGEAESKADKGRRVGLAGARGMIFTAVVRGICALLEIAELSPVGKAVAGVQVDMQTRVSLSVMCYDIRSRGGVRNQVRGPLPVRLACRERAAARESVF